MRKSILALAALLSAGMAVHAHAATPDALRAQLKTANALAGGDEFDAPKVCPVAEPILADPGFAALADYEKHDVYYLNGTCEILHDHAAASLALLDKALALPGVSGKDWNMRLFAAGELGDHKAEVESLRMLAAYYPDWLGNHSDQDIVVTAIEADRYVSTEQSTALLDALFAAHWQPTNSSVVVDGLWFKLATVHLAAGDEAGAEAAMALIHDPDTMVSLRIDRRFDAVVAKHRERYDVPAALNWELARSAADTAAAPDKLEALDMHVQYLLEQGHYDEALTIIDGAIARMKANPKAFSDQADQANWALDFRARVLERLGRFDEALAMREAAAKLDENGGANVSQAINLADIDVDLNHPQEALDAMAKLGRMSGYGQMAFEQTRTCAYAELGDKTAMAASLAFVQAHADDAPSLAVQADLCAGDMDDAARLTIKLLAAPGQRGSVLSSLQDYRDSPTPPHAQAMHAAMLALRARPDVAAAIDKVGRILRWDLAVEN